MDFGPATFDASPPPLIDKTNINNHGSVFTKPERSDPDPPDDPEPLFQTSKSFKTESFDLPDRSMSMGLGSDSLLSVSAGNGGAPNNMLSFSSSSTNNTNNGNQSSLFSFYQPPPAYIRSTGGLPAGIHVPVSRYKGPFTPSQWMELEHQALIFKHFVANVPVPSHLLNTLRRSLDAFAFPGSSSSSYARSSYEWGTFRLGNTDPEPGRCRRTDGKKWRCSKDAVPDHKYCERHINRGRHRSRKPVEGHNGHAVSAPTTPKVAAASLPSSSRPAAAATTTNCKTFLDQNPFPHFEEWSKDQTDRATVSWPKDWTQLSMSIPMASSVEPLGLFRGFDFDPARKQASPISMGGPLGEVLNQTASGKNASSASELTETCRLGCSPTGVLQKTTFVSLSNSSSGGSPKANKNQEHDGGEVFLSTLAGSSSFPSSL